MKIGIIFGNPPYNEIKQGNRNLPLYHLFMDAAEYLAPRNILVTPARFLFDAGKTPKAWNHKKLEDPHFRVLQYESDATVFFPNTEIKGGVVITEWDKNAYFPPVKEFFTHEQLKTIVHKVCKHPEFGSITSIISPNYRYKTEKKSETGPSTVSEAIIQTNAFIKNPKIFTETKTAPDDIKIFGLAVASRCSRWIKKDCFVDQKNLLPKYKVLTPKASGGVVLSSKKAIRLIGKSFIAKPGEAATATFMTIGGCETEGEAQNLLKYLQTKFARILLASKKITQHNNFSTWVNVPIQNFTDQSDIDWDMTISEIDQYLYKKYGLTEEEILFTETHISLF